MITVKQLGLIDYSEALQIQEEMQQQVIAGGQDHLLVCSHPSVITYGQTADLADLKVTKKELEQLNIKLLSTKRGGKVTLHNPGQIILYPIINLKNYRTDVDWYLRRLEAIIIQTLAAFGVEAVTICGKTGVWLPADGVLPDRKIASIGVRFSRWVSMHGLAVNIFSSEQFNLITPCGLADAVMTDLAQELSIDNQNKLFEQFSQLLIENFCSSLTGEIIDDRVF